MKHTIHDSRFTIDVKKHIMNFTEFLKSLEENNPPTGLPDYLVAIWYDGKGDWQAAHNLIDSASDKQCCWVHAYLHRKEGDIWNADYWYRRAGKTRPTVTLDVEWAAIAKALL